METRRLGRLGHDSTVLIYGAAGIGWVEGSDVADRSIEQALAAGINHFDTAADYGDSELHLGRWMPSIRERIFLATKTGDREAGAAHDSVRRSLERLQTDRVDLIQIHAIGNPDELDEVTRPGGALEGLVRARDEGLARAIGITGHGMLAPATHLEALRRFAFDTVLTPWNWRLAQVPEFRRDFEALVEEVRSQGTALMVMKALARHLWRAGAKTHSTWYEPITDQPAVDAALAFVLARAEVTGITTAGDVGLVPMLIEAEGRRASIGIEEAEATLSALSGYEPPFVRAEGRVVPDFLEHLVPN